MRGDYTHFVDYKEIGVGYTWAAFARDLVSSLATGISK